MLALTSIHYGEYVFEYPIIAQPVNYFTQFYVYVFSCNVLHFVYAFSTYYMRMFYFDWMISVYYF